MSRRRVLFVDDEQRVLGGLRRRLHTMRHRWAMTFVKSGAEALDALAREPFDAVVTDMRMPGMDGAELLARVHASHGEIVRIVLSGYSDTEHIGRTVHVAHQFLTKPCDAEIIERVVDGALDLRAKLRAPELARLVGQLRRLPAVPSIYERLLAELHNPRCSTESVGAVIEQDAAMSAKLLQIARSSFVATSHHITSVHGAVTRLGFDGVKNLCLGLGVFNADDGLRLGPSDLERHQRHAAMVGSLAAACFDEPAMAQEAFLAGMLHDLGELILAGAVPEAWARVRARGSRKKHEAELAELGTTHGALGAYLLALWGLPRAVVGVVAHHHAPSEQPACTPLTLAVHVAEALATAGCVDKARALLDPGLAERPELFALAEAMLVRAGDGIPAPRAA